MGFFRAFSLSPRSCVMQACIEPHFCRRALTGELGRISLQKDALLKGLLKDSAEATRNKQNDQFIRGSQECLQKQKDLFIFNYRTAVLMSKETLYPIAPRTHDSRQRSCCRATSRARPRTSAY